MKFASLFKQTSIQIKLVVPIVTLALLGGFAGTKVIEDALVGHITKVQKHEIKNFANKIYYVLHAEYKTLFFEFGKDADYFAQAQEASQKESIANLAQILENSGYEALVFDAKRRMIPLGMSQEGTQVAYEKALQILHYDAFETFNGYFGYRFVFTPWGWDIVVLKPTTQFQNIVSENKKLVFTTLFVLMFLILLFLFLAIYEVIQKPFQKVFEHLDKIKNDEANIKPLEIHGTKETAFLSDHINSMYASLVERKELLVREKTRNENILNSQTSIVIASFQERISHANNAFFEFFSEYKTIEEFKREHECVCDFFEKVERRDFIYKEEKFDWIEKIVSAKRSKKVLIKRAEKEYIFDINAKLLDKETGEYVVNMTDITSMENYKEQLEASREKLNIQLHTDELTKLPNRLSLSEKVLEQATVSLVLININDFKEVNDFYGVQTGDKVLRDFAKLLKDFIRERNYEVFRLSGDEFAIFIPYEYSRNLIVTFVETLLEYISAYEFHDMFNKRKITLSATAGAAIHAQNISAFVNADIALKTAKKRKKPFMTYKEAHATKDEFGSNLEWASKLKNAFKNDKVVPFYQPIYNNQSGKIEKYEALVRLIDDKGKAIAPFFFLNVAKRSHQYFQLTETMLEKCFEYFKDKEFEFSINLSESDISDIGIHEFILQKLEHYNFGSRVVFEILETENIDNYENVSEFIKSVKYYGAKIAIDDFGSGFSNFQRISQLNVDYIKIDGSLIQNILSDKNSLTIVETIATFAKRLGVKTIAEFVDSQEIQDKVVALGIDYTQGYFISQPKPDIDA
jgi:diguanylate cyclase (GGDEF)-like protein